MRYSVAMRLHISLADAVVQQLDSRVGSRRRSEYIEHVVSAALEDDRRWADIEASIGAISDEGHVWDDDPAAWVRAQRRGDSTRVG
ncbi:MAG: hypothetical protein ACRDPW_11250 [Mycobacteriales bacterium]